MKVCLVQRLAGVGGPAAFQRRLTAGLEARGVEVTYDLDDMPFDAALVINATRSMGKLRRRRREGVRVVQRLGGLNWQHRFVRMGLKTRLQSIMRNFMMRLTRSFLADQVVYQSEFVKDWWERAHGPTRAPNNVIHNGVDLTALSPTGDRVTLEGGHIVLSVEGTQGTDPFRIAERTTEGLAGRGRRVRLTMFGQHLAAIGTPPRDSELVDYRGVVPQSELVPHYRGAAVFVSTDVIAACPNSAIEAMACGTPVLGYRAGALPELVGTDGGVCVEPEVDPLTGRDPGNAATVVESAEAIIDGGQRRRLDARQLAEARFDVGIMVDKYVAVLR